MSQVTEGLVRLWAAMVRRVRSVSRIEAPDLGIPDDRISTAEGKRHVQRRCLMLIAETLPNGKVAFRVCRNPVVIGVSDVCYVHATQAIRQAKQEAEARRDR